MEKITMICAKCGGQNVLADAYCNWSVEDQQWEINNVFSKGGFCEDCDGPCRVEEREASAMTREGANT